MKYLNISLSGLNGKCHPALNNIITSHQVKKSRIHLKMLAGNFLTFERKAKQSGGSPHCRSCAPLSPTGCTPPSESLVHMLTMCIAYNDLRNRICEEYAILCSLSRSEISWQMIVSDKDSVSSYLTRQVLTLKNEYTWTIQFWDLCLSYHVITAMQSMLQDKIS